MQRDSNPCLRLHAGVLSSRRYTRSLQHFSISRQRHRSYCNKRSVATVVAATYSLSLISFLCILYMIFSRMSTHIQHQQLICLVFLPRMLTFAEAARWGGPMICWNSLSRETLNSAYSNSSSNGYLLTASNFLTGYALKLTLLS